MLLIGVLFASVDLCMAQQNTIPGSDTMVAIQDTAPYLKYPTIPAFNILAIDSVTLFNTYNIPKGRPCVLMFFDPDCKHCKATTKLITEKMDSLQDVDFYLFSARHDMEMIRGFYKKFHLDGYPNIKIVGMDTEFFFFSFYKVKFVPDLAIYDKNGDLVKLLDGACTVREIFELTRRKK
jgi:thioredoxin-related protein